MTNNESNRKESSRMCDRTPAFNDKNSLTLGMSGKQRKTLKADFDEDEELFISADDVLLSNTKDLEGARALYLASVDDKKSSPSDRGIPNSADQPQNHFVSHVNNIELRTSEPSTPNATIDKSPTLTQGPEPLSGRLPIENKTRNSSQGSKRKSARQ